MLTKHILAALSAIPGLLVDLVGIAGVALITYGAWRIYEPAGFIVCGSFMVVFALLIGRSSLPSASERGDD